MKHIILTLLFLAAPLAAQPRPKFAVQPDVGSLYAYDDNGRLVGAFSPVPLSASEIGGLIRMEVDGEGLIYLAVSRLDDGGLTWNTATPWFESTDCKGPAFAKPARTVGDRLALIGVDGMLYVGPTDGSAFSSRSLNSRVVLQSDGTRVCVQESGGIAAITLREIAKLDDEFKPPFVLEAALRQRAVRSGR